MKEDPFRLLSGDVVLYILSYVSYAPFELDLSYGRDNCEAERLMKDYNMGTVKLGNFLYKSLSCLPYHDEVHSSALNCLPYHEAFHSSAYEDDYFLQVTSLQRFGTLTHVFPLVNKRFRVLCSESNILWTESLERLVGVSSFLRSANSKRALWEKGIVSFTESFNQGPRGNTITVRGASDAAESERLRALIADANACVRQKRLSQGNRKGSSGGVARLVLREVFTDHNPVRWPVLTMPYPATLNEPVSVSLHQPRYRQMIAEVMAGRSNRESNGHTIHKPRPRFLFSCKSDTWKTIAACVVELRRCQMYMDGTADIVIIPIKWVLMEHVFIRPDSGGLWEAAIVRSPRRSSLPVFCMRSRVVLGRPLNLRMFEERYRILIRDVMAGRSDEVGAPPPEFVYAHQAPMKEGDIVCVVEVIHCRIVESNGTAFATVIPRRWVLVERLTVRPGSGRLFDATILYPESTEA